MGEGCWVREKCDFGGKFLKFVKCGKMLGKCVFMIFYGILSVRECVKLRQTPLSGPRRPSGVAIDLGVNHPSGPPPYPRGVQ